MADSYWFLSSEFIQTCGMKCAEMICEGGRSLFFSLDGWRWQRRWSSTLIQTEISPLWDDLPWKGISWLFLSRHHLRFEWSVSTAIGWIAVKCDGLWFLNELSDLNSHQPQSAGPCVQCYLAKVSCSHIKLYTSFTNLHFGAKKTVKLLQQSVTSVHISHLSLSDRSFPFQLNLDFIWTENESVFCQRYAVNT